MNEEEYSVSSLGIEINKILKNRTVDVIGEVTDMKRFNTATYFKLKEDEAIINSTFFKQIDIKNGDKVKINGKLNYYLKYGTLQINGNNITNIGVGLGIQEQEKIKKKYEKMGYFNNKKKLPSSVRNIGVVTSREGAVIKDIIYALRENNFNGNLYLYSCNVQGVNCPSSVSNGIKYFDDLSEIDVILIARGGGSFDELSGFSHPKILEALYKSSKYTISAVGHETDTMLCDEVSNYRCPTPSIAGTTLADINNSGFKKIQAIENQLKDIKNEISQKLYKYKKMIWQYKSKLHENPVKEILQKLDTYLSKSKKLILDKITKLQNYKRNISTQLELCDINIQLEKGFVLYLDENGNIIKIKNGVTYNNIYMISAEGKFFKKKLKI
jgi:exodeoxyribonuclease VII large subunit